MTDSISEKIITSSISSAPVSTIYSQPTSSKTIITSSESSSSSSQGRVVITLNNSEVLTLGGVTKANSTSLINTSTGSVNQYSSNYSTFNGSYSVATQTVTNFFSAIKTVTLYNSSHITTQTLPNSEITTKTLSDQIMTLGGPIATYTTVITGSNIGTSLTSPLYLSGTTIYPNYGFDYTQFFIITKDNTKRDLNTVMEILINVPTQPLTATITTDVGFYRSQLKGNIDTANMILYHFGSSLNHSGLSRGAKLGAILGGVFGGLGLFLLLATIFLKFRYHSKEVDEEELGEDNQTSQHSKSNLSVTDGFSHHSGRRVNVFEETEFLEYSMKNDDDNLFFKILSALKLKKAFKKMFFISDNNSSMNEIVDPYNDEFDFKNRHLEPPVIVNKSAMDIVNESNPFSDIHEASLHPNASLQNQLSDQDISLLNMTKELSFRNDKHSENDDDDSNSMILETVSISTLSPKESIKQHGMLREVFD